MDPLSSDRFNMFDEERSGASLLLYSREVCTLSPPNNFPRTRHIPFQHSTNPSFQRHDYDLVLVVDRTLRAATAGNPRLGGSTTSRTALGRSILILLVRNDDLDLLLGREGEPDGVDGRNEGRRPGPVFHSTGSIQRGMMGRCKFRS
mmetsp:Transcript_39771/g.81836  ORF Transcript_39771/g.81836 Transcript_39771/m.81836 type:complete len:147 (+) Transcript_39771:135-575(+)